MRINRDITQLTDLLESYLKSHNEEIFHYSELARIFKILRRLDKEVYLQYIKRMPASILGDILLSLNERCLEDALEVLDLKKLINSINALESDDATDLIDDIEEISEEIAGQILEGLDNKNQEEIQLLRSYDDDHAGSYMQLEVFIANHNETIKETIERFRILKKDDQLENISSIFITGDYKNLVATISLEDLILFDLDSNFRDILQVSPEKYRSKYVRDTDLIDDVASLFKEYELSVIPVIDEQGYIMGRITSDDIFDILQEIATEQMYNLAGVDDDAEGENRALAISKKRGKWQFLNMCTAFFSASVIGQFEETIELLPALAVLMPIVASMGGNTGNQALTVMVRQLAMGDIDNTNWDQSLFKEIIVALMNGCIFGTLVGIGSYLWFNNTKVSIVIGIAIFSNFAIAGFCGTVIPIFLKKMNTDPAVGSSILLTMITDALGFFIFLGLAQLLIF